MSKQGNLFSTQIVPGKPGSGNLFDEEFVVDKGPIVCLGLEFDNDEARRTYFTEELRKKLNDPEFRNIEGFPIGEDEDILRLSDPPYYTACPNPWIPDFIEQWEKDKPKKPEGYQYHREPFAADVSEGKNDPIYNAHSYHTKVPHKAVMRYILHYTDPGDIVFDGFAGTGMTGVAAQMCGDREAVLSLGYQVKDDGTILQQEEDEFGKKTWKPFSKLGARKAVLNDLSPAATFIAYNYNTPVDVKEFEREAKRILAEVEEECGWMYETKHSDGRKGRINYTVWSDVFTCPECAGEVVFWEAAVDKQAGKVQDSFPCPHCKAELTKRKMDRAWTTTYDSALKESVKQAKQVPVLINYTVDGHKGRFEKAPDEHDLELINKIENSEIPYWFPTNKIIKGDKTNEPIRIGITHVHHFYTKRNLWVLGATQAKFEKTSEFEFLFTGFLNRATKLNQLHLKNYTFGGGGCNAGHRKGTLYTPSISMETPVLSLFADRLKTQLRSYNAYRNSFRNIISTSSANNFSEKAYHNSLDYVFIDPPFGANLNYSELSFAWEAWLKVRTNNKSEAIESRTQKKGPTEYRNLMEEAFKTIYDFLKPGRWVTIEFSNTKAYVWNIVQNALSNVGFIVANVSALDKKQGGMSTIKSKVAVLKDLVISAYKPNGGFEERFLKEARTEEGVWDFIHTHFQYLPVTKLQGTELVVIPERDPRILYDQVITYYVRKGYDIPIDSQDFQAGLSQRFSERDGMYFLPEQVAEYDQKKLLLGNKTLLQSLFISDEASAIEWLRGLLRVKPQSFQDINPQFMKEISGWSKNEVGLELSTLLEQNFLIYDGKGPVPEQIHSYLSTNWKEMRNLSKQDPALVAKAKGRWYVPDPSKAGDLEKLRERALLKEFEQYKQLNKKLKVFRLEAVRTGFKKAWQDRDYKTIVSVAEKIPSSVLEEDSKLLMWYDQAVTRMGEK
jgi:rubredoxin